VLDLKNDALQCMMNLRNDDRVESTMRVEPSMATDRERMYVRTRKEQCVRAYVDCVIYSALDRNGASECMRVEHVCACVCLCVSLHFLFDLDAFIFSFAAAF
jgi:hypothetical protein